MNLRQAAGLCLLALLAAGCVTTGGPGTASRTPASATLTILATTDVHGVLYPGAMPGEEGGSLAQAATLIGKCRSECGDLLLLDAGDMLSGSPVAELTAGNAVVRVMNELGYDAVTLGNHDLELGPEALVDCLALAKFVPLAAAASNSRWTRVQPTLLRQVGEVSVGIVSYSPQLHVNVMPGEFAEFADAPAPADMQRQVDELRAAGAQVVVLLAHAGYSEAPDNDLVRLLDLVSGIDVAVAGHSHRVTASATTPRGTLVVQPLPHARQMARIDVQLRQTPGGWTVAAKTSRLLDVTGATAADTAVLAMLATDMTRTAAWLAEPVGELTAVGNAPTITPEATAELAHDALAARFGAELTVLPATGIEPPLSKGKVTRSDLYRAYPYADRAARLTTTGDALMVALELARNDRHGPGVTMRGAAPAEIDFDRTYVIATTTYQLAHELREFTADTVAAATLREAVTDYLRAAGRLTLRGGRVSQTRVALNAATQAELDELPGIGPALARKIVVYRRLHGDFASVEELDRVTGIGPALIERIRPQIIIGEVVNNGTE